MPRSLATPPTSFAHLVSQPEDPAAALAAIVLRILQASGLQWEVGPPQADVMTAGLTPREREVLELLRRGCSNRQIADQLVVGVRTVETHVEHILRKLNVSSRTQAIAACLAPPLGSA